ncbi:MAG: hypothetical protein ABI793_04935 [Flavobacterium sp.]
MKNIFIMALVTLFVSCAPEKDDANCHVSVNIINNSNKVIYFGGIGGTPAIGYNPLKSGDYFKIIPGASKIHAFGRDRGCYEDLFAENNNKLYYLIFDEQVLKSEPWDSIVKYDKVLKRYSFSVEQMNDVNWKIIYDGN